MHYNRNKIYHATHRFCAERLQSMVRTLELQRLDEYSSLQKVASFATLVATYEKGESLDILTRCFTEDIYRFLAHP